MDTALFPSLRYAEVNLRAAYGTGRFTAAVTKRQQLALSWPRQI